VRVSASKSETASGGRNVGESVSISGSGRRSSGGSESRSGAGNVSKSSGGSGCGGRSGVSVSVRGGRVRSTGV
jgi:hypothetical protein